MTANLITLRASKTYATRENAIKAVEKTLGTPPATLRYFLHQDEQGRFFPVFVGQEAIHLGVHFHFNAIG